jgi:hypothetical protein
MTLILAHAAEIVLLPLRRLVCFSTIHPLSHSNHSTIRVYLLAFAQKVISLAFRCFSLEKVS